MKRILLKNDITRLLNLISKLLQACPYKKHKPRKGRPVKYSDEIIILALLLKQHMNLSFRDLEEYMLLFFPRESVPDFSSIFYRFKTLDSDILECIIKQIAQEIEKILNIKEYYAVMADGTGFGYDGTFTLSYLRGKRLREVKSHIKTEVLIGIWGKYVICVGIKAGKAYTDEIVLLNEILSKTHIKARYFIADAYYGKIELIRYMEESEKAMCIIPIKDTPHRSVRNIYRKSVKERYEDGYYRRIYKKRSVVERFIGNVKNKWGDRDRTKEFRIAVNCVLARFLLWNLQLYLRVRFLSLLYSVLCLRAYLRLYYQPSMIF